MHLAGALGLGGAEVNPYSFAPFGGLADDAAVVDGRACLPNGPGIGFESKAALHALFVELTF